MKLIYNTVHKRNKNDTSKKNRDIYIHFSYTYTNTYFCYCFGFNHHANENALSSLSNCCHYYQIQTVSIVSVSLID